MSRLLTQREVEILSHVAEGLSNKEIAAQRFLSTETVKKHLSNAYRKLEADSRVTALARARALGVLPRSGIGTFVLRPVCLDSPLDGNERGTSNARSESLDPFQRSRISLAFRPSAREVAQERSVKLPCV